MVGNNEIISLFSQFSQIDQIGIVVRDMEATMKFYRSFGLEPFLTLESAINTAKLKIGLLQLGDVQLELIQVLEGKTIHSKFLEERGEGVHHLGHIVVDLEKELIKLEKGGIKVLERGMVHDMVKFAYLDTEETLGVILELIQLVI